MRLIAIMLAASFMLAGCADNGTPPDDEPPTEAAAPADDDSGAAPPVASNTTLELLPSIALNVTNGTAPLTVNITLDAAGNGSWQLFHATNNETLLSEGLALPANVQHTFEAGNHSLRLVVSVEDHTEQTFHNFTVLPGGPAVATTVFSFTGGVAEGDTAQHPFVIDSTVAAVTAYLSWNDGLLGNAADPVDLDLFLKGPGETMAAETLDFEYIHGETTADGAWTAEVLGYSVPVETTYKLDIIIWHVVPQTEVFTGASTAGYNYQASAGDGPQDHALTIPEAQTVAARLGWDSAAYGECASPSKRTNDWDLATTLGGSAKFSSGNFAACEFGFSQGEDLSGDWVFTAVPFLVADSGYTLTVFWA